MLAIESNVDCYITIVDVDPEGRVTVLFPNDYQNSAFLPDGRLQARTRARVPDALEEPNRAGFFWDYSPPAGLDVVQVFAATDLETAVKLRAYLGTFAEQSVDAGGDGGRGIDTGTGTRALSSLRAEMAVERDWTAVPVTIKIEQ
jgi:hypothetical protein